MVTEDRKRAIKLLAGMGIIFIGGMSKEQKAQHDFRVREITNTLAAVRKERDAEWSIVAEYFINKADALKDVRRNVDAELIAALDNYYAAREGLKAFIEEVK